MPSLTSGRFAAANSRAISTTLALKALALRLRSSQHLLARTLSIPFAAFYRAISLYVIGFDIPTSVTVGRRLVIHHGMGLVINDRVVLEDDVILRQNTTIGSVSSAEEAPYLEEGVDVGANVVILGPIRIGRGAIIGAGSVVIRNVPAGATVVGNPARVVSGSGGIG